MALLTTASAQKQTHTLLFTDAPGSPFKVGTKPSSVAIGDFNRDGKLDLAIVNEGSDNVTVLLGNGKGGFTVAQGSPFKVGTNPSSVAVGDFNGDSSPDLAVANEKGNNVTVLMGNGKGGFNAGDVIPTSSNQADCIAVGDFNGDRKVDLAVANFMGSAVSVLLGNGKGGFAAVGGPYATRGWWFTSVAVGDFNGDGKLDIVVTVVADFINGSGHSDGLAVLLNDGKGGFKSDPNKSFATQKAPHSVVVADFNGDGKLDLATANEGSDNITVLLGDGTGRFLAGPISSFKTGSGPYSIAVGDFNGDGKPDLAITNRESNNVTVLLGDGKGGFMTAGKPFPVGTEPFSIAVGDFNGDGKADLAVVNSKSNNVTVLLNTSSSSATPNQAK